MEDHDDAYRAWKAAGLKGRTLLHLDAHIDFKWILPDPDSLLKEKSLKHIQAKLHEQPFWNLEGPKCEDRVHLGNYIHQAIREEIISEFIWIYPEDPDQGAQARAVQKILEQIALPMPRQFHLKEIKPGLFSGIFCGIPFTAAPWSHLEHLTPSGKALLNIDLDFCIISSLHGPHYPFGNLSRPGFWLTPENLVRKISAMKLNPELTTLAYSVEEGYTPLALKFLGKELGARLSGSLSEKRSEAYALLKKYYSAGSESREETVDQLRKFSDDELSAEGLFCLTEHAMEREEWDQARALFERAIHRDPSYRSAYNHPGPILWDLKRWDEAEASYSRMKKLDPDHPDVRLFEVKKQVRKKNWDEVIWFGKKLMSENQNELELRFYTAGAYFHLKRYSEAWSLLNSEQEHDFKDLRYLDYCWLKVQTAEKLHDTESALAGCHQLSHWMPQNAFLHWKMALLYVRKQNAYKMRKHLAKAFKYWALGFGKPLAKSRARKRIFQ